MMMSCINLLTNFWTFIFFSSGYGRNAIYRYPLLKYLSIPFKLNFVFLKAGIRVNYWSLMTGLHWNPFPWHFVTSFTFGSFHNDPVTNIVDWLFCFLIIALSIFSDLLAALSLTVLIRVKWLLTESIDTHWRKDFLPSCSVNIIVIMQFYIMY